MSLSIHNYILNGSRLVQIESQARHIDGVLDVVQDVRKNSNLDWDEIYSSYYECEEDGTITFYEGESAEAGNPGVWTYVVYDCPDGQEEVVVNPKIDVLTALLQVKRGIQARSSSGQNLIPHAENAVVDIRKLRDYCLNPEHDEGKHKARLFLSGLGMTADNAEELQKILLEVIKTNEIQLGRRDSFGQRYTLDFQIEWQNKSATLRSGWIIEHGSTVLVPRATHAFIF